MNQWWKSWWWNKPTLLPGVGRRQRLTAGWSRVLLVGWSGMVIALVAVGSSSHVIGRPVFWLDDQRWGLVGAVLLTTIIAVPIATLIVFAYFDGPWITHLSLLATLVVASSAFFDRHRSPGSAVVLGALSGAGVLLTVTAYLVRSPVDDGSGSE